MSKYLPNILQVETPYLKRSSSVFETVDSELSEADKEIGDFKGFHAQIWKSVLFYTLAVFTGGISLLLCKWSTKIYIVLSLVPCSLNEAQYVLVKLSDGRMSLERIRYIASGMAIDARSPFSSQHREEGKQDLLSWQGTSQRHALLEHRCKRYFYVDTASTFRPVPPIPRMFMEQLTRTAVHLSMKGRRPEEHPSAVDWNVAERMMRYGSNEMSIPVASVPKLIFNEMWHPFYVFQYFSIIVWVWGDQYYSYSVCIFVITWFSIITSAVESYRNRQSVAKIAHFECEVSVLREGQFLRLPSVSLVPGDMIVLQPGTLPCDVVLMSGECIVDENMLTGESVPVRKVPFNTSVDGMGYHPDKNSACTLFGGTSIAQARAINGKQPLGIVCRTRFCSAKGQLLRSILFPVDAEQSFVSDSLIFIAIMLTACMCLYIWAAVVLHNLGASGTRIMVRFFDMITVAVPPALPACLAIATVLSINRLRRRNVFVTGPERVAMAGQLDVICFDKTGTLTEQGLHLQGVVEVTESVFKPMTAHVRSMAMAIQKLLATCHGLAMMDGVIVGDPLDQRLFLSTGWELLEHHPGRTVDAALGDASSGQESLQQHDPAGPSDLPLQVPCVQQVQQQAHTYVRPAGSMLCCTVIKRFEFSAALQRNMVVVQSPPSFETGSQGAGTSRDKYDSSSADGDHMLSVFMKGSPEAIRSLVTADSVPADFDSVLAAFTREGLRVLALASGNVSQVHLDQLDKWGMADIEQAVPLHLVGLVVMANPLRPDSASVVHKLQDAGIRTAMVTGDHLRTAVSVAHLCHIMPSDKPVLMVDAVLVDTTSGSTQTATPTEVAESGGNSAVPLVPAVVPSAESVNSSLHFQLSILHADGTVSGVPSASAAATSVAEGHLQCAVTGKGFCRLMEGIPEDQGLLFACLYRASVFARMSPDNKRDLMKLLGAGVESMPGCPHLGLHVGFCGDGANDCGALKAAHVGVSLCEAEASVAAPMTSKHQSIASMLIVVAEGRCSLMATFQIFQFIIAYAMVQAFETNLMYTYAINVGNYQYLIQDLFFTTVLAALMGYTEPRSDLSRHRPVNRIMSLPLAVSTSLQLIVIVAFQMFGLLMLSQQPGYVATVGSPDLTDSQAPENTTTYIIVLAQYVILALVFNKGKPHRSPLYTNYALLAVLVAQGVFVLYSLFSVDWFNEHVQDLVGKDSVLTTKFRVELLLLIVLNAVAAFTVESMSSVVVALIRRYRPLSPTQLLHSSESTGSRSSNVDISS